MRKQVEAMGRRCLVLPFDVSKLDAMRDAMAHAQRVLGPLDILVNNAGVEIHDDFVDVTEADYDKVLAVNVKGPFFLAQGIRASMQEGAARRQDHQHQLGARGVAVPALCRVLREQGRHEDDDAHAGHRGWRRWASPSTTSLLAPSRRR